MTNPTAHAPKSLPVRQVFNRTLSVPAGQLLAVAMNPESWTGARFCVGTVGTNAFSVKFSGATPTVNQVLLAGANGSGVITSAWSMLMNAADAPNVPDPFLGGFRSVQSHGGHFSFRATGATGANANVYALSGRDLPAVFGNVNRRIRYDGSDTSIAPPDNDNTVYGHVYALDETNPELSFLRSQARFVNIIGTAAAAASTCSYVPVRPTVCNWVARGSSVIGGGLWNVASDTRPDYYVLQSQGFYFVDNSLGTGAVQVTVTGELGWSVESKATEAHHPMAQTAVVDNPRLDATPIGRHAGHGMTMQEAFMTSAATSLQQAQANRVPDQTLRILAAGCTKVAPSIRSQGLMSMHGIQHPAEANHTFDEPIGLFQHFKQAATAVASSALDSIEDKASSIVDKGVSFVGQRATNALQKGAGLALKTIERFGPSALMALL